MKPETRKVWKPLKAALDKRSRIHYFRIENSAAPGTPDLNIHVNREAFDCDRENEYWVELKLPIHRTRNGRIEINCGLRKDQYIWLRQATTAKRTCLVFMKMPDGRFAVYDGDYWELLKDWVDWYEIAKYLDFYSSPAEWIETLL